MTTWVLMTAMPPTTGHRDLISFAAQIGGNVNVLLVTQPHEPYVEERGQAIEDYTTTFKPDGRVLLLEYTKAIEQDPTAPGFWEMWDGIFKNHGFKTGDIVVSSEPYGKTIADRLNGVFIPYDLERTLNPTKATAVRQTREDAYEDLMPEFRKYVQTTVTIFGAESTGKTTLAKRISQGTDGAQFVYEWARPYLECVGPEISVDSMNAIAVGQAALQRSVRGNGNYLVVQDTDLYSTIGYWEQPHWRDTLGDVPVSLLHDARQMQSDLYIITRSDIPFEEDPLRYGGDHRESSDEYWIGVAEKYGLNYVVLPAGQTPFGRASRAWREIEPVIDTKFDPLAHYDRGGF